MSEFPANEELFKQYLDGKISSVLYFPQLSNSELVNVYDFIEEFAYFSDRYDEVFAEMQSRGILHVVDDDDPRLPENQEW